MSTERGTDKVRYYTNLKASVFNELFDPVHNEEMFIFVIMSYITSVEPSIFIYGIGSSIRLVMVTYQNDNINKK